MKTTKKLTAILLCIAMLLGIGATNSFALEIGDTVEVSGYDYTEELVYKGILKEGINEIEDTNEEYSTCYTFEAAKDGYYIVKFPAHELSVLFTEDFSGNKAKIANQIFTDAEDEYGTRYFVRTAYLTKGTALIHIEFNGLNHAGTTVEIEYFAESIEKINYDETAAKYLFEDCDDYYFDLDEKIIGFRNEYSISFTNGKTLINDSLEWIECKYKNDLVTGENTVTMIFPGYEKEIVIGIYKTSDFVENVELENYENYLDAKLLYNNEYIYETYNNENISVKFKDGSKETINYKAYDNNYVTFPCGKEVYIQVNHTTDETAVSGAGKLTLYSRLGYTDYNAYECNTEKADISDNADMLKYKVSFYLLTLKNHYDLYAEKLLESGDFAYWIERCISDTKYYLNRVTTEISQFVEYYL